MRWVRLKEDVMLQVFENDTWLHYTQSQYYVKDYPIPNGSKGFATAQKLLKLGYVYEQAKEVDGSRIGDL